MTDPSPLPETRTRRDLDGLARWFVITATDLAIALSINQLFNLQLFGIALL